MAKTHPRPPRLGRVKKVGKLMDRLKTVDRRGHRAVESLFKDIGAAMPPGETIAKLLKSKKDPERKIAKILSSEGFPDSATVCHREIKGPMQSSVPAVACVVYDVPKPPATVDRVIIFVGLLVDGTKFLPLLID